MSKEIEIPRGRQMEELTVRFIKVCAYCGEGELDCLRARNRGEAFFITHGICAECAAEVRAGRMVRRNPFPASH